MSLGSEEIQRAIQCVLPAATPLFLRSEGKWRHLENLSKLLLATGILFLLGYVLDAFSSWYSTRIFEKYVIINEFLGPYAPVYYGIVVAVLLAPQLFWLRRVRRNSVALFLIALTVLIGMWLERLVTVISSLSRDYLPSAWGMFTPSIWDWAMVVGGVGLFLTLMLLFIRFLPIVSIYEMRELVSGHGVEITRES